MTVKSEAIDAAQQSEQTGLFSGKVPIEVALNELRLRLLDLTGRNRLVNFKHSSGKSLQFVHSTIDGAVKRLTETNNRVVIAPLPEPDRGDFVIKNGRLSKPEPKEWASRLGIATGHSLLPTKLGSHEGTITVNGAELRTLYFAEDLGKHCRKLEREAKLAIEETGANMLYLVAGFMEFPEAPGSEKLYQAPLLCIPVQISKVDEGQYSSFYITHTGEELSDNPSLREKLKRDFGFNLPEFDPEGEESAEQYLAQVDKAIERQPDWSVKPMLTLTLLSFTNMLLVRDLDPTKWQRDGTFASLLEHPLIKQVFEGKASGGGAQYAVEYAIDDHPRGNLPLIFDADSSQHSALIDVIEGHNRVIEGPPGTGKSQTITNLIAAGLQAGKKILFVAEKLAALEVVKSRLHQAGLSQFILELHSNKTSKKRVLEDIEARIGMRIPPVSELPGLLSRHEEKRKELKVYADLMNTSVGNELDLTLHQVMWRAERHRLQASSSGEALQDLDYFSAPRINQVRFAEICDRVRQLSTQFNLIGAYGPTHPLWGFFPKELSPEQDFEVQRVLKEFALRFASFAKSAQSAASLLGGSQLNMSAKGAENLLAVLDNIAPADADQVEFEALPRLFPSEDPAGQQSFAVLQRAQSLLSRLEELANQINSSLYSIQPAAAETIASAEQHFEELVTFGLAELPWQSLEQTALQLTEVARTATEAVRKLRVAAEVAGLPTGDQISTLATLEAAADVASVAPMEFLNYRQPGVDLTISVNKLTSAARNSKRLTESRARADALMYLDSVPAEPKISEAIHTLREGDTWYRIFQASWRKAKRVHKDLSRDKRRKSGIECLKDLELLVQIRTISHDIRSDNVLKEVAGPWFDGEKTPFDELLQVALWLARARERLDGVGLPAGVFDPLVVKRSVLETLRNASSDIAGCLSSLDKASTSANEILQKALPRVLKSADSTAWTLRIDTWATAARAAKSAHDFARVHMRPEGTFKTGLAAMHASHEYQHNLSELEDSSGARDLIGSRFNGAQTDLSSLFAAHAYGSLIRKVGLPKALERVLVSEKCEYNYASLKHYASSISKGWRDSIEFNVAMGVFGRFEPSQWVDPTNKVSSVYAVELAAKTELAANSLGVLLSWVQYVEAREQAVAIGLEYFLQRLETGVVEPSKFEHAFIYRFYASIAKRVFDRFPTLTRFSGAKHTSVREEYAELDRKIIQLRGLQIAHTCRDRSYPPAGQHGVRVDDKTEMKLLEHLMPQQRPRVPVRQILRRAGRAIQELKPCFMMGPQAVAQFLEPGRFQFDIIVMDEASQLRPEQAIGAIARGSQLVVVGDPKQLPPTSFFSRMAVADGDGDQDGIGQLATSDAESILDVCIAHFQPVRTLRWHYRSRHESLIAFSNHHFYNGNLIVFPSPYPKGKSLGLSYHHIKDGVYENQINQVEARRVVDAAVEHILQRPEDSLGIVTLNIKQRDLVAELLEERLRNMSQALRFREKWEAEGMGLFVKNLENVQGDERDCILISTTFGKAKDTNVVRQNFGPISREGGWRRLNVLFTRARKTVAVYSSMMPEDIVSDVRTPEGTRALRNYLEYARDAVLAMESETGRPPDSDFEVAVMDVLRSKGYEVTPQLGVAGFRIDIAVKHPRRLSGYLAAIECDGASYHSGVSVRDRDRIRQEILESLGWRNRIWRIWSTDWFRNPLAETERVLRFLAQLETEAMPEAFMPYAAVGAHADDAEGLVRDQTVRADAVVQDQGVLSQENQAEALVFYQDEEDLEIEIGDLVTFTSFESPGDEFQARLTARQTDPARGLIAHNTPLGAVLMGATVGETVVLRVPGQPPQSFVIKAVKRDTE